MQLEQLNARTAPVLATFVHSAKAPIHAVLRLTRVNRLAERHTVLRCQNTPYHKIGTTTVVAAPQRILAGRF